VDAFFTDSRELIEQADALARNYGRITRRGGMKRFLIEMDDDAWAAMCREQRVAYKCGDGAELCGIPPEDKDVFYDYLCRRSGADMVLLSFATISPSFVKSTSSAERDSISTRS